MSLRFWNHLLGQLRREVALLPPPYPRRGFAMLLTAFALAGVILWQGFGDPEQVVEGFRDWLWR